MTYIKQMHISEIKKSEIFGGGLQKSHFFVFKIKKVEKINSKKE